MKKHRYITSRRDRASKKYRDLHLQLMKECKVTPWWVLA